MRARTNVMRNVLRMGVLLSWVGLAGVALGAAPEKSLHYLVVDRSGSIADKDLPRTLTEAVKKHINTLGEKDEVRVIFFSDLDAGRKAWPSMTFDAKMEFGRHFEKWFKPSGNTFLFDCADKVLDEVIPVASQFADLKVLILSDGDDSMRGKIRSWDPIVAKACQLIQSHPSSLITFYTIGFDPSNSPAKCIQVTKVELDQVVIPPDPPRADFEAAPREVLVGEEVTFFARRSPGKVDQLVWSFGDGATASGPPESHEVVKHAYAKAGTRNIQLLATGIGGRDEKVKAAYVVVKDRERPVARFTWSPEQPRVGQELALVNQSAGNPEAYRWTVGGFGTYTDHSPKVMVQQPGSVLVELIASKGALSHTAKASVVVLPLAPDASFTVEPAGEVEVGQTLSLKARATGSDVQHRWTINETPAPAQSALEWKAEAPGTVTIVHEAQGPGGVSSQREKVFVRATDKPDADFVIEPEPVELGADVRVRARQDQPGWEHAWTIDGRPYQGASAEFRANKAGAIPVIHEVGFKGQTGRLDRTITVVEVARVTPAFTASPRKGKRPLTVQFKDRTEGVVTAYAWSFGDGAVSTDRHSAHTYSNAGSYTVRLEVENKFGHRTASTEPAVITVVNPMPGWIWPAVGGALLAALGLVAFVKTRPVPPGGTVQWDLAEGGRSKPVTVSGTRFDLGGLKAPGWKADGSYAIVVRGGKRVVLKDDEVVQELGRDKKFKAGGINFRYMNQLLEE